MKPKKVLSLLVPLGLVLGTISFSICSSKNVEASNNDGGVFICEDTGEEGPIFYPADYSSEITNEPSYSTQNTYTFSSMNFTNTHKYYRGDSVKVAVIDSGLNYTHEDFEDANGNQIIQGHSRTIDNQSGSWLYYQFDSGYQSRINDTLGHGTNVASVIASQINALGCAGIAPNVELYVYKVTNTSNGYEWTAINSALSYCVSEGIDVINMSFQAYEHAVTYNGSTMSASTGCSSVMTSYINSCYNAGITLVAAAGNYNTSEPSYPASNNHVISVGSLAESSTTTKAAYSNTYGIDLVAPGTVYVANKGTNTAYKKTNGTSFSAPIVTAAIALYKQQHPTATPSEIESALYASCDSISGNPAWAGNGRLNIDKFLGVDVQNAPVEIVINNSEVVNEELELEVGDYLDLDYTVNGVGTFDHSVNFYTLSGEDNVVSVNSNGRITATGVGSDYVVIESNADSSVYASVYVTVTSSGGSTPTVSSVTVSPSNLNLDLNGTTTGNLSATVNGTNNPSQAVSWSSSNTSVATVSASGVVTAKATGNATITATSQVDGTKSGTCTVTVSDSSPRVNSVSLNKSSLSLSPMDTETLVATVNVSNGASQTVSWTSSDTNVATVSNGTVTAVSDGTAIITARSTFDNTKYATCSVTVATSSSLENGHFELVSTLSSNSHLVVGDYYMLTSAAQYNSKYWYLPASDKEISSGDFSKAGGAGTVSTTNPLNLSITDSGYKLESATSNQFKLSSYNNSSLYLYTGTINNTLALGTASNASSYWTTSFDSNKVAFKYYSSGKYISAYNASPYGFRTYGNTGTNGSAFLSLYHWVVDAELDSISVETAPTKTSYEVGDYFDPTGLVIRRTYSDSSSDTYTYSDHTSDFTFSPTTSTALTQGTTSVTITYGGKSCSQAITVSAPKTLSSISISGQKTSFVEGDTFFFGGTVTAHYNDSSTNDVTASATYSGYNMTTVGSHTITVSYTYKGTTKTATYTLTINKGTLSSIAVSGQTTIYMKNNAFSFDGICTATFANGYQKTVTPTSVSSPDMSTAGNKDVTVSFTYNGVTRTTSYQITVNANRTVIEETSASETYDYSTGSCAKTGNISDAQNAVKNSGYVASSTSNGGIQCGSSSQGVSITFATTKTIITKVRVYAKQYSSSEKTLRIGTTTITLTDQIQYYDVDYLASSNTKSIDLTCTAGSKARFYLNKVILYSTTSTNISNTEDCVGLESFIDTYLHMNYVENLGYCKDNEHHYYSSAKTAFNALNEHQRTLFTTNSAYTSEYARLSAWANANGETLNGNNQFGAKHTNPLSVDEEPSSLIMIVVISLSTVLTFASFILIKKKKECE